MSGTSLGFRHLLKDFNLNKGDTIMLVSDVSFLLHTYKKNNKYFDINLFIDSVLEKIGKEGTLLIPTYNYDFCKGCGICSQTCPTNAIRMEKEDK